MESEGAWLSDERRMGLMSDMRRMALPLLRAAVAAAASSLRQSPRWSCTL